MNEVFEALNSRIKAPYFGYAILAFFALNWRGIFLLVVDDSEPVNRLALFDSETSFWTLLVFPLLVGAVVAASAQWLKYIFLLVSEKPLELIENSNLNAVHKREIRQAELEQVRSELTASREKELIERAKRDESISEITDEDRKKALEEEIGKLRKERDIKLSSESKELLKAAAEDDGGVILKLGYLDGDIIQAGKKEFGKRSKREYTAYYAALRELVAGGFVQARGFKDDVYELTNEGWKLVDVI